MDIVRCFLSTLLGAYALTVLVHAQDQSDFISIDCGGISEDPSYTGINYISDAKLIDTGISKNISSEFKTGTIEEQYWNVRSFPEGIRNCYKLKPRRVKGYNYLIRASFMYGNYDAHNQLPEFDLYLGVNKWDTVKLETATNVVKKEIIHVPSSNSTDVCLVNTDLGMPFISILELRLLKNTTYQTQSGSLALLWRLDFGSTTNQVIRFKEDVYDRIWSPAEWLNCPGLAKLSTLHTIGADHTDYQPPSAVMSTAITLRNASEPLAFSLKTNDSTSKFHIYMHFAELEVLQANQSREFNISLNGNLWNNQTVVPSYLNSTTIYSKLPVAGKTLEFLIQKTENSNLPPIINAIEVYMVKQLLQSQTNQEDVDAMMNIKSTYGVKRNWQEDPCAPAAFSWEGLGCRCDDYDPPRIISLNLSSSGLTGEISTYISNLRLIRYLDLSNNNLTGQVPRFLSQLPLRVLNLTGNNLTGSVPEELIRRSKNGWLSLSVGKNPNLCSSVSCEKKKKNESLSLSFTFVVTNRPIDASVGENPNLCSTVSCEKNIVVPVVASVAAFFILLTALAILWKFKWRKQQVGNVAAKSNKRDELLESKNQFTYSEVLSITNNFERVLGKGGFGRVYHGYLDDTQVAVKMLSPSSIQGYKQFHTEVKLLMRVHHRNLTSLVGYCNEGDNMGLIYEFMANGNLEEHLSDRNPNVLSWEERLRIAMDTAQGLEYLHSGCRPPIIHRDVKSTNILLNEKFQAKLADFGLSRVFPIEEGSHVSTVVAGTPGYLDPEYYVSNRLNEKSDVFGFGVVLLEIITSQPMITRNQEKIHISNWVSDMLATKGDVGDVVDPRLRGDYDINSVQRAVEVAMVCVSLTAIKRPTMNHVVMELKQCFTTEMARKEGDATESKDSIETVSLNMDA